MIVIGNFDPSRFPGAVSRTLFANIVHQHCPPTLSANIVRQHCSPTLFDTADSGKLASTFPFLSKNMVKVMQHSLEVSGGFPIASLSKTFIGPQDSIGLIADELISTVLAVELQQE